MIEPTIAAIEGLAHSSPIVWDDRVFVTTAVSDTAAPVFRPGYSSSGEPAWNTGSAKLRFLV